MATCSDPSCSNSTDKEGTLCPECSKKKRVKTEHNSEPSNKPSEKKDCPLDKFKITDLTLWVDAPDDKLIMNVPDRKVEVKATMSYIKTSDTNDLDSLPTHILFTFTDPSPDNTKKVDSYKYNAKYLGKKDDASAEFWDAHSECSATKPGGSKIKCKVQMKTLEANKKEIAKVYFKPSGVGGDDFKLKATLFSKDGNTKIKDVESNRLVVWRKISFTAYEMNGQNHVSTHGTNTKMSAYYTNDTYVDYNLGTVTPIPANKSVKYIGLWDHASSAMLDWSTHSAKTPSETPTNQEKTKANGSPGVDRTAARNAIQIKANAWKDRIHNQFLSGMSNWITDAGAPENTIIAIENIHPKYDAAVPNGVSKTNEWSTFPWLQITIVGETIHPDERWKEGQGLAYLKRMFITTGMGNTRTEVAIAHEAGHETNNQFKRRLFGPSSAVDPDKDHTSGSGLMDRSGSRSSFTAGEKKILRGFK